MHPTPKRVDALRGVIVSMVSCGGEHTVIADSSHSVYSWGAGNMGQLGMNKHNLAHIVAKGFRDWRIERINKGFLLHKMNRART